MPKIKKRYRISQAILDKEFVEEAVKAQCLQTALYDCTKQSPFLGTTLQCMNIFYSHMLPTAGVSFNNDQKRWDMLINPRFFCVQLNFKNRVAVLLHEISHVLNRHPLRVPFSKLAPRKRMLMNIAADMAINQFIKDLPAGCQSCPPPLAEIPCKNEDCPGRAIDVENFSHTDSKGNKTPFKHNQTMEHYYEELIKMFDDPDEQEGVCQKCGGTGIKPKQDGQDKKQDKGQGKGQGKGDSGELCDCQSQGEQGNAGGGANHKNLPQTLDVHDWDGSGEEADMLDAVEELVKRAMVKQSMSFDELPGSIKDLLQDITARKAELNYKAMILSAIKRSASGHDRVHSWNRKSKRFGLKAPGTKLGELPKLHQYIDTSGSISIEEANEFLDIVDHFLRAGSRKCRLGLFHTELYFSKEYRLGKRLNREEVQSGGTCLQAAMRDVAKRRPDLAIFLTDGYYGDVEVEKLIGPNDKFPQCLFIISREGEINHPLKRLGQTVKIPSNRNKE